MSVFGRSFWRIWKDNSVCRVVLLLECGILLILFANCLRARCQYSFTCNDLYTPSGLGEWITDENGTGYRADSSEALGNNILVNTDFFVLYPGSYTVRVVYASQVSDQEGADYSAGTGSLNLNSNHNDVYYHFDSMLLRDGLSSVEQTVQVTSPWKISDFQITVSYGGEGSLIVYAIEITESVIYKYLGLLGVFAFFLLLDAFCCLMFLDSGFSHRKELGILTLICVAACLPYFADWIFVGEDSTFWTAGIRLLAESFSGEKDTASVLEILTDNSGRTASSTCGFLFLFLPAFLFHCGFSLTFVYNFYICVLSVATCLITYYSALSVYRKSNPALLACALYTLSAPRLTCILSLASLGEMTAMALFPLILAGFYHIYEAPAGERIHFSGYVPIVIGLTGILHSYLPAFWMTCLLLLLCCFLWIKKTVQRFRLAALFRTAVLTLLINLLTILPVWRSVGETLSAENVVWENGAYLIQIFNSVVNNYQPEDLASSDMAGSMSMSVGFSVTLGLVLFLVYLVKRRWRRKDPQSRGDGFAAFCWGMTLLTIFLSSSYMAYEYLDFLPEPFLCLLSGSTAASGWLPFAVLFGVFCTCAIADSEELKEVFQGVPVILLLCMALTINTGQIYSDQMRTSSMERLSNNLYENLDAVGFTQVYCSWPEESEG